MRYVTNVERMGIQKGIRLGQQEGRQEGKLEEGRILLKRLLNKRFKALSPWVHEQLDQATQGELEQWVENTLDAASLEDVFR
ncbi:MAG: DUF4351 domain-containing protein [Gammaproteobacteria bacterium]|nr:DUF4351 domain-containing protein [Gammaproteobacteria bacterium]MBU1655352.1 DUF4351 domain-containing protein [Gammaproteobacteria bacterium]MBU1960535.1 DUF4351 domain-containing protein [Gammaproteobacteria bacterium]